MRVTFVYPDFSVYMGGTWSDGRYNVGLGYLSAVLKQAGHETRLVHITEPVTEESFAEELRATNPDLIAFSSTTHMYPHVQELVVWARRSCSASIVYGGVHPTLDPQGALETEGVDIVCVGEGERPLLELCDCLERGVDHTSIANLWLKGTDGFRRNPTRPLLENLDELPIPDRSLFNFERMDDRVLCEGALMASRGCPFNCTYCCNHAFKSRYPNQSRYVRFRSVDLVLAELRAMLQAYPWMDHFYFHDDILNMKRDWFEEFVVRYKREIGLPFRCYARVNLLDEESVRRFAEAGCYQMDIGIESGNAWMREKVLNRHMSNEAIIKAFALAREYGVGTKSLNMIGLPFETLHRALDTVKLNAIVRPSNELAFSIFYPYPHTQLYELCREKGYLTDKVFTGFFESSILNLDSMSEEEVRFIAHNHVKLIDWYGRLFSWPRPLRWAGERALDTLVARSVFRRLVGSGRPPKHVPKFTRQDADAQAEWQVEFLGHDTPARIGCGRSCVVRVTFCNIGRHALPTPRMSRHAVNLSYHWLDSRGRIAVRDGIRTPLPDGVATGEVATLKARVQAPESVGDYTLVWDFVREGVDWLGDVGSPTVAVPVRVGAARPAGVAALERLLSRAARFAARLVSGRPTGDRSILAGYRARLIRHTLPGRLRASDRYLVQLRLLNNGKSPWLPPGGGDEGISVGYAWRPAGRSPLTGSQRAALPGPVAPGDQVEVRIVVETPPAEGDFHFAWRLFLGANGAQRALAAGLPESRVVTYS